LETILGTGKAIHNTPQMAQKNPTTLPKGLIGYVSPYPTVVIVTIAHQNELGIEGNMAEFSATSQKYTKVENKIIETMKNSMRKLSSLSDFSMVLIRVAKFRECLLE
jgi:hypothetical protein